MAVTVPGERRHPLTLGDAELVESVHQLLGTAREVGVRVAVDTLGAEVGHDLGRAKVARRMVEEQPGVELDVHHRHLRCTPFMGGDVWQWSVPGTRVPSHTVRGAL
jgi:hypothetical protein